MTGGVRNATDGSRPPDSGRLWKQSRRIVSTLLVLLAVVAVALSYLGYVYTSLDGRLAKLEKSGLRVPGTVVAYDDVLRGPEDVFVRFRYEKTEQVIIITPVFNSRDDFTPGSKVTVLVDPDNVRNAGLPGQLDPSHFTWYACMIVFVILTFVLWAFLWTLSTHFR